MNATTPTERTPRNLPDISKAMGARIRKCREEAKVTQEGLANRLKISRSAIAQWESGTTTPSITSLIDMAEFLRTTPEYLAFDITSEVRTIFRSPEREDMHTIDVIDWGDKPDDVQVKGHFALDQEYLQEIAASGNPDSIVAFDVPTKSPVEGVELGDRLLIDTSDTKVRRMGTYVLWNGFSADIVSLRVITDEKGKPAIEVTEAGHVQVMPAEHVKVLGKVVAHWGKA